MIMESWECKLRDFFGAKYFALITIHTHDKELAKHHIPLKDGDLNLPPKISGISEKDENRPKL